MKKYKKFIEGYLVSGDEGAGIPVWQVKVDDPSVSFNGGLLIVKTICNDFDNFTFASGMRVAFLVAPFEPGNHWCAIEVRPLQAAGSADSGLLPLSPEKQTVKKQLKSISFIISKERTSFYVDLFAGDDPDEAVKWLYQNYPNRDFIYLQSFYPEERDLNAYEALSALLRINPDEDGSLGNITQIILAKFFECGVVHIRRKFEEFYS